MPHMGISPNEVTATALVKSHVKVGDLDYACKILHFMVKQGCQPNSQIYRALLGGCLFSDNATAVEAVCSSGDSDAGSNCSPNNVFREIKISHSLKLLDKIKEYGSPVVDLYNFLAMDFYKVGRICEGDHFVHDMVWHGLFPNKVVCSLILEHLCRERRYDCCLTWMKLILDNGIVPSFASYCSMVVGLHSEGKDEEARGLLSDVSSQVGVEDKAAVLPYIEFLGKRDDHYECLQLLNLVGDMHNHERPII